MNDQHPSGQQDAGQGSGGKPPPPTPPSTPIPPPPGMGYPGQQIAGAYIPPSTSSGSFVSNAQSGGYVPTGGSPAYPPAYQQQWQPQNQSMPSQYDPYGGQSSTAADPFGSFDPMMGASPSGGMPGGSPPPPPPPPKQSTPANFQLGSLLPPVLKIKLPVHTLQFDEQYFLHLLAGSISLTKDEKVRIIESMPKLKQSQVDELVRIFEEERRKFAELGQEHVPQLEKLVRQHYEDWLDIEMRQQQQHQQSSDQQQADEIRKQLGL